MSWPALLDAVWRVHVEACAQCRNDGIHPNYMCPRGQTLVAALQADTRKRHPPSLSERLDNIQKHGVPYPQKP
jgi:hypothetical protein